MGRTLHYKIKKNSAFTQKDEQNIISISDYYNDVQPFIWTRENFYINPHHELDRVNKSTIEGFTKVKDNEFNALLVLMALTDISKKVSATIYLYDEGKFLACPVWIKKGKVLPDLQHLSDKIGKWCKPLVLYNPAYAALINEDISELSENFKDGLDIDNTPSVNLSARVLRSLLQDSKLIYKRLEFNGFTKNTRPEDLEKLSPRDWFDPMTFARNVNFKAYIRYYYMNEEVAEFDGMDFGFDQDTCDAEQYNTFRQTETLIATFYAGQLATENE